MRSVVEVVGLSIAGICYAAVTAITVYASAVVQGRASPATAAFLDKIAGILLTAIAVTILASGGTRLVVEVRSSEPGSVAGQRVSRSASSSATSRSSITERPAAVSAAARPGSQGLGAGAPRSGSESPVASAAA